MYYPGLGIILDANYRQHASSEPCSFTVRRDKLRYPIFTMSIAGAWQFYDGPKTRRDGEREALGRQVLEEPQPT